MESQGIKRGVAAGIAAIVLGGASLGIVSAQAGPAASPVPGPGGQRQGVGQQGQNHQQRHDQFLNTLAGKLGVSVERLRQAMTETRTELGVQGKPGGHRGGPGGHGGVMRQGFSAAAKAIGITEEQLRQELPGKSLAQIASARNVSTSTLVSALKTEATTRIDQAVQANRLSADQANQIKQNLDQRLTELVNRTFPAAGQGPRGPQKQ